ncbi:LytR cell envelope-related transcriptional attenuator [Amycolatopsis arida]|uniref:LytR cell envelope-related transcriptional attenuator n=1 Tax=Amycolatopsis arida TaxID=587909 RepID=A0A1I5ZWP0_9PSEU|nr:envelope integrity protein Cei [Amycolatopsis arida]TDX89426.1 LytR cell envelope-related transcriptional attenuator [Amycolatopsis arida]SFQ60901.1 LytR cell envelope-related transcriptional attenuator [Amycolatopsis arida]
MASGIGRAGRGVRPYRRRRPGPALIVFGVLAVLALSVWGYAITNRADIDEAIRCEPAAKPPDGMTYTRLGHDGLDGVTPLPPDKVGVRVLNAGAARNQAAVTTEELRQLGFTAASEPANDPAYEKAEADCRGQIRFGTNGAAAARTLSLVEPCAELIRDERQDASVDLAIGTRFGDVRPRTETLDILRHLREWSNSQGEATGGEQSAGGAPDLDPALLRAARDAHC